MLVFSTERLNCPQCFWSVSVQLTMCSKKRQPGVEAWPFQVTACVADVFWSRRGERPPLQTHCTGTHQNLHTDLNYISRAGCKIGFRKREWWAGAIAQSCSTGAWVEPAVPISRARQHPTGTMLPPSKGNAAPSTLPGYLAASGRTPSCPTDSCAGHRAPLPRCSLPRAPSSSSPPCTACAAAGPNSSSGPLCRPCSPWPGWPGMRGDLGQAAHCSGEGSAFPPVPVRLHLREAAAPGSVCFHLLRVCKPYGGRFKSQPKLQPLPFPTSGDAPWLLWLQGAHNPSAGSETACDPLWCHSVLCSSCTGTLVEAQTWSTEGPAHTKATLRHVEDLERLLWQIAVLWWQQNSCSQYPWLSHWERPYYPIC